MTLDDLYAQLMGLLPAGDAMLDDPALGASPSMTPWQGTGFGFPLAVPTVGAPPESTIPDENLGVTTAFGRPATAPAQYGYSPRPRPVLPAPILDDAAGGLYGPFRDVWEGMQTEPDPLAALLTEAPPEQAPAAGRPGLPWPALDRTAPRPAMPSRNEQMLAERHPRVVERLNWLRGLRASRGY